MQEPKSFTASNETNLKRKGPSKMAEGIALQRVDESNKSEEERIFYDPYAIHFETDTLGQRLFDSGYERSKKTLFIMEGLIMYLPSEAVDETLSFISKNSGKGSTILFDYYPESVVDGTCELEVGKNIRNFTAQQGEPLKFGIMEGTTVETFLTERGFSRVQNVTAEEYKKRYFHGINKDREVCSLLSFAYAVIE